MLKYVKRSINKTARTILVITVILSLGFPVTAQQVSIELGPDELAMNQPFTITITVENDQLRSYGKFPDIDGFYKRGTSSSSSTNIINGKVTSKQSITQNYMARQEGSFTLNPFTMDVNGQEVRSPGKKIKVGPARQQQQQTNPFQNDPFQDFFNHRQESQEFMDIKEDAFLALSTSKDRVYLGEGFTVTLAFYVAEGNRAPLQFYEPARQLSEILKKLKPANCWEENFNIDNLNAEPVTINNKRYSQYKIYQATYYPLNLDQIDFPSVPFKMIKYKVAKNPTFFGRNRVEDFKIFNTKPRKVIVRDLPPHPLKDQVSVGNYKLREDISDDQLSTGKSFSYSFTVYGEGNISAIDRPEPHSDQIFEFYPPNVRQNINRGNGVVSGNKSFSYYIIPNEPGDYSLNKYFSWIYFNPVTEKYDTLKPTQTVHVTGESKRNDQISSNDLGTFYDQIEIENNRLAAMYHDKWVKTFANLFILIMLGTSIYYVFKK